MSKRRTYLHNAALLTGSGLVLRALGMGFRIVLAAYLGSEGMGLYQLILALYMVFVSFATAGVNVASARLAAQSLARGSGMAETLRGLCITALGFGTGAPGEGARAEVMREVREHFSPELLGRLDEVLVFGPLAQEDLVAIGETLLRELEARAAQQGIRLAHTPAAARLLVREAYEPSSGARSLRRAITRRVEQCLAQQLLGGVENGAAADFLLDAPQDVLSLARRCGTAANAAQGGGEADAPEQNAAAPAPDTVQACNL